MNREQPRSRPRSRLQLSCCLLPTMDELGVDRSLYRRSTSALTKTTAAIVADIIGTPPSPVARISTVTGRGAFTAASIGRGASIGTAPATSPSPSISDIADDTDTDTDTGAVNVNNNAGDTGVYGAPGVKPPATIWKRGRNTDGRARSGFEFSSGSGSESESELEGDVRAEVELIGARYKQNENKINGVRNKEMKGKVKMKEKEKKEKKSANRIKKTVNREKEERDWEMEEDEERERKKKRKTIWDPKAKIVEIDGVRFRVKPAFDIFWKYTSERHALEERRRRGESEP